MSWTPCPECGSPLVGHEGSVCTTPEKHVREIRDDAAFLAGRPMPAEQLLALDTPRDPPRGCAFSKWLFAQQGRLDAIGQLAHVVARDPRWQGGDRVACLAHLVGMGANEQTQRLMGRAYDEWARRAAPGKRVVRQRAKRAAQKAARKHQRR